MNQAQKQFNVSPASYRLSTEARNTSSTSQPVMDAATYGYNPLSTLSSTLLNTPVSFQNMFTPSGQIGTDFNSQVYNDFDLAFGIASQANYPEPPSGPESPSYWHSHDEAHFHDDTTGDESVEFPSHLLFQAPHDGNTEAEARLSKISAASGADLEASRPEPCRSKEFSGTTEGVCA